MRSVVALVLLLVGCAPGPTSQETYAYPGCEPATYGPGCDNDLTYECALETIRRRHASCVDDQDCTLVTVGSASPKPCSGTCPRAVAVTAVEAFTAETGLEEGRYCETEAFCGTPDCAQVVARCRDGRCEARTP